MAKLLVGPKLLAASGVAGAAAAAVVASAIFFGELGSSPSTAPDTSAADTSASGIDYNCNLAGKGRPWLRQDMSFVVGGTTSAVFVSTVPDVSPWAGFLPVPVNADGTVQSMDDVYRRLCLVTQQLGGGGLTHLSNAEANQLIMGGADRCLERDWADSPYLYTDGYPLAVGEDRLCVEEVRTYWLPPLPRDLLRALADEAAATTTPPPSPGASGSPSPSPSATPETRRYRVVVNGYENQIPNPEQAIANGVRFTYRLIGEFSIERSDPSKPWTVASRRIVTVELTYESLYPPDSYQVTLSCHRRSCERLQQATRLYVQVHGDEATVSWGYYNPEVHITGTCTGCAEPLNRYAQSDDFFARINSASVALEQNWTGPLTVSKYPNGAVQVSFAYGLEQLP